MYTIEFQAQVKDGVIEVPSQYRDKIAKSVRVIILAEREARDDNLIDQLLAAPLRLQDLQPLKRDEIYVRA